MHPLLSDKRKLASTILAWLVIGILIAKLMVLSEIATWSSALYFALPVIVIYGFIACSAYYVCRAIPMTGRRLLPTLLLFCTVSLSAGAIWLGLCLSWANFAGSMAWWEISFTANSRSLLFFGGGSCYLISMVLHDVLIALDNVRIAELNAATARVHTREAELQMLRAQINPHFLFNSLNSISALTSIDSSAARAMTIALADFFRQSLTLSEQPTISLSAEIALCNRFLEVEKIRFGSKLQHVFELEDSTLNALIPPMLLQPLIENAIKHGIRNMAAGGEVSIVSMARDKWLHLTINNPCEAAPSNCIGNGLGLNNIKQRLNTMYGTQARINWNKHDTTFSVEITLPLELTAPE